MASPPTVVETSVAHRSFDVHATLNQYEILYVLGEGMHGKVMLAHNKRSGERVAIKSMRRIDPRDRRLPKSNRPGGAISAQQETESKIRREIAVMKKCSHQNLVQLLEVIDDPKSKKVYLVMENLAGGEVLWRNKDGPSAPVLALDQVQRIMRDVTLGLEYLHHQGIIHRDIKPANLLWTADRQSVKICDFGVSHFFLSSAQDEAGLSKTAGSPAFFAPEICSLTADTSLSKITNLIDIWALGVTFYCLLFGTPPWQGHNEYAMFHSICCDDFVIPDTMACERIPTGGRDHRPEGRGIGWCVVDLLCGLLKKEPDDRITLAYIKRIPWIHTGVRDPERWLRETTPGSQTRVTVTDQDTRDAIRIVWYSDMSSKIVKKIRSSFPTFSRSRSRSASRPAPENAVAGPSATNGETASHTRSVVDRQIQRFGFGGTSPSRANTVPRRRHAVGEPTHSHSDPVSAVSTSASLTNHHHHPDPMPPPNTPASPRGVFGSTHPSISSATSPTLSEDIAQPVPTGFRSRISEMLRQKSPKVRRNKARSPEGSRYDESSCGTEDDARRGARSSWETLDYVRSSTESESARLSFEKRSASWGGVSPDEDGDASSETDPTSSVKAFGAGGYADRPSHPPEVETDSSSNNTPTPQPHSPHDAPRKRVTSPLAHAPYNSDPESGEISSDPFEEESETNDGPDSSDEEEDGRLELHTRRPSMVLPRSANTSPRR